VDHGRCEPVGIEDFPHVTRALDAFAAGPAVVKGLNIPQRNGPFRKAADVCANASKAWRVCRRVIHKVAHFFCGELDRPAATFGNPDRAALLQE
jgi:hypothetical protein